MSNEECQKLAPSFYHLPNDGALFKCDVCKERKSYKVMIKPFTPDGVVHYATCLECVDKGWLAKAKDCGVMD